MRSLQWVGTVLFLAGTVAAADVTIEPHDDRYTVKIDGQLFTEYIFKGYAKPILYPVIGPHGIPMTRNWPIKDAAPGESKDHPHQKSLWFAHGDVNGIDFWAEGPEKGKIVAGSPTSPSPDSIFAVQGWLNSKGAVVAGELRTMRFARIGSARVIDIEVKFSKTAKDLTFGDSKEGTMAIRTRPELEINHGAKAINSEGVTGKDIWGKRANWVDYSGVVDGHTVGIAIFDHPSNPRHPTWWHAREYGLIAANPFGIHDFEKKPPGAGNMKIPAGQSVRFRYRFIFHEGDAQQAGIARMYETYAVEGRDKQSSTSNVQHPTSNTQPGQAK